MKKVLISGASGLIGTELARNLPNKECRIVRLVRRKPISKTSEIFWDPSQDKLDSSQLEGFTTVIHLAGKNIASGRWNLKLKEEIRASRIKSTKLLCESLARLSFPPKLVISASAIGFYGPTNDQTYTEESEAGPGFLASICVNWEAAIEPLTEKGIRVVNLRLGMVLSDRGGALSMMLPVFKLGLGGVMGDGCQYISWIALEDVVDIIHFIINNDSINGPINTVTNHPVTNREFTKTLGRVLKRPTICKVPRFLINFVLAEMAHETLLANCRVAPKKLLENGYKFNYPHLEDALKSILER